MKPTSATSPWIVGTGFLAFLSSLWSIRAMGITDHVTSAMIIIAATASANFLLDFFVQKVYLRPETGLNWTLNRRSFKRFQIKYIGLLGSVASIAVMYWLFPEYHGDFYASYWSFIKIVVPVWLVAALPYFYFIDSKMNEPEDGYYNMGLAVLLHFEKLNKPALIQHLLGWLVKGFFLPLMLTYFVAGISKFAAFEFSSISNFKTFFDFSYDFIFLIDVGVVSVGYIMSMRLFDTHLRWAEPTLKGWVVALICYQPFWSLFGRFYAEYSTDYAWGSWLGDRPALYMIWGSLILILYVVYVWSSVMFGCRFSNLTHRGILTNGPYAWAKHPAYISKNIAWWLTSVPFVSIGGPVEAVRRCALLLLLNYIYYLRAKTEESHLSADPVYVSYSKWIERNGIFRAR